MIIGYDSKNFKDEVSTNQIQNSTKLFANQVKLFADQVTSCPFVQGIHMKGITLTAAMISAGVNRYLHNLRKVPIGHIVTNSSSSYAFIISPNKDDLYIYFDVQDTALLPITFDVWVF